MTTQEGGTASRQIHMLVRRMETEQSMTLGDFVDGLGRAGIGLLVLVLTLPAMIPIPGPFGMVFGSCLALVSLQVIGGARRIWLPEVLRRRHVGAGFVRELARVSLPWLGWIERFLKPRRLKFLTGTIARALLGIPILVLAVIVALPIPLGNIMPVIALVVIAVALMERDGGAVLVALLLTAVAVTWTAFLIYAGSEIVAFGWNWLNSVW